jgi:hypothetical protein
MAPTFDEARDAHNRMHHSQRPGLYFLAAGHEKRMSTFAQQNRAITLVGYFLDFLPPEKRPQTVAVIGAGAAGMTAAVLFAWRGVTATLYEQSEAPVGLLSSAGSDEKSDRYIHPRLYEWPAEDWNRAQAQLPVLDWNAGTGEEVTKQFLASWEIWKQILGEASAYPLLRWRPRREVREISGTKGSFVVQGVHDGAPFEDPPCDLVIVAIGPNKSETSRSARVSLERSQWNYWGPERTPRPRMLVFGRGDSGLIRAAELGIEIRVGEQWEPATQRSLERFVEEFERLVGDEMSMLRGDLLKIDQDLDDELKDEAQDDHEAQRRHEATAWSRLQQTGSRWFDELITQGLLRPRQLQDGTQVNLTIAFISKGGIIDGKAFPLHRWLFAQLVRCRAVTLVPEANKDDLDRDERGWFLNGRVERFDDVILAVGSNDRGGPLAKLVSSFERDLKQRGLWRGHGTVVRILRRQREPGDAGSRLLYSDLFDSTTQARVLDELVAEQRAKPQPSMKAAEDELIALYRDRLMLEVARRDQLVLGDTQVLDGAFFLRWLPAASSADWNWLSTRIVFTRRPPGGDDVWRGVAQKLFLRPGKPVECKRFEFSALGTTDLDGGPPITDEVAGWLQPTRKFDDVGALEAALVATLGRGAERWYWMRRQQELVATTLRNHDIDGRPWPAGPAEQSSLIPALDEPAKFAKTLTASQRAAWDLIYSPVNEKGADRSVLYPAWNVAAAADPEVEVVRAFYDRAYNRAIAAQHGATVFESFRVEGLPKFSPSEQHAPRSVVDARHERRVGAGIDPREQAWESVRAHQIRTWRVAEARPILGTVGARALQVLRGCNHVRRLWIEEALEVGTRTPAVIDEEIVELDGNPVELTRVEYLGNIERPDAEALVVVGDSRRRLNPSGNQPRRAMMACVCDVTDARAVVMGNCKLVVEVQSKCEEIEVPGEGENGDGGGETPGQPPQHPTHPTDHPGPSPALLAAHIVRGAVLSAALKWAPKQKICRLTYIVINNAASTANITGFLAGGDEFTFGAPVAPGANTSVVIAKESPGDCEEQRTGRVKATCAGGGAISINALRICVLK